MADVMQHRRHDEATWLRAWDNRKLVFHVAAEVRRDHPWLDPDDVLSAGIEGLCRAYEGFRPETATKGTHYCMAAIRDAITREVRQIREMVHVPGWARREGVPADVTGKDETVDPRHGPEADSEAEAEDEATARRVRIVHEALARLTPRQRSAIEATYGLGPAGYPLTTTEAAAEAGINEGVFCNRRKAGVARFRAYIQTNHPEILE